MNNPSILNMQTLDRDALLNDLLYLKNLKADNGDTLNTILTKTENKISKKMHDNPGKDLKTYNDELRRIQSIREAIERDPSFGDLIMNNKTQDMVNPRTGLPYEKGGIKACTFQNSENNPTEVTVVFSGTGKREWLDNGIGLSGYRVQTEQQIQATEYYDYIVKENGWDQSCPQIHLTGHSKGGNKAQFVVMTSDYGGLINNAYSFDGQCFSPEAIQYLRQRLGDEEFESRRNKLFSISADNDYVNILGVNDEGRVIPSNHIFFLKSRKWLWKWHFADSYINDDGTLTDFTDQEPFSKVLQGMSETLMDWPSPLRELVTEGCMGIAQIILLSEPLNGEDYSYSDILAAVPLFISLLPAGLVRVLGDELGINTEWLSNFISICSMVGLAPMIVPGPILEKAIGIISEYKDKLISIGNQNVELTKKAIAFIELHINRLISWFAQRCSINSSSLYGSAIEINTYSLHMYSGRLRDVNRRISYIDSRLNTLYGRVGLRDLWTLLQADFLTGFSWKLLRCSEYLDITANEFDRIESRLIEN